jgi:oligoendopeptidase F
MVNTPEIKIGAEDVVWDLSVFYDSPDDPQIDTDMHDIQQQVTAFVEQYRGQVAVLGASALHGMMQRQEEIYEQALRIYYYAMLLYAEDTNNETYGAFVQRITQFFSELQQQMVFADLEWKNTPPSQQQDILTDPTLGKYKHPLEAELRYKPFTLSEPEEKVLIATSVHGRSAWTRFFSQLTSAMRYQWGDNDLSQSEILAKLYDSDRTVRQKAAESVTDGLKAKSMELTFIFNVLAGDKATKDNLRGYPSWISSRNLSNKAPDEIVEALINTVTDHYELVTRHYNLKRILLGLDELYDYDRYAPLPLDTDDKRYTWEQAQQIVLNAFGSFSPQMSEIAGYFFDQNWIHAPVRPGKRGGAFSASATPNTHPFVLLNYLGQPRDVSTLAHELGHGVHQYLANREQGLINADTPLTTSEMASVFGEMLVFTDLMERETNPKIQLSMLVEKIEDTFATVFRQISMNRFENLMHNAYREQGELSTATLNELWLQSQRDMFGNSITITENYGHWWSYIPHFLHTPGYVYAYAFGELLVLALFELYKQEGDTFAPKYIDILASGGSDYPDRILAKAGIDLNDPTFWQKGIAVIQRLVEQEEALARQVYPEKFTS